MRKPRRDNSSRAASHTARGGPNAGLGKLEPMAIRMGSGKALLRRDFFASRAPLTNVKVSRTITKKCDEITINQEFVGRVSLATLRPKSFPEALGDEVLSHRAHWFVHRRCQPVCRSARAGLRHRL